MTAKSCLIALGIIVLVGASAYVNRDWFSRADIQIHHRSSPRPPRPGAGPASPILFGFDRKVSLQEVKVVPIVALATNKFARPVWHLVSDSNSVPVRSFYYGSRIPGMRPAIKGALPDILEPGVQYRLRIISRGRTAEHDFEPTILRF